MPSDASPETPKRSADQIEADLARTREELAETLSALADKVNPKIQAARAAEHTKAHAATVAEIARARAQSATAAAKDFAGDVAHGKPTAIAIVAAIVGIAAGAIAFAAKRRA
jgi:ElaB/YqjD/DUF883 family membrane-anchored ribosome-binding protein